MTDYQQELVKQAQVLQREIKQLNNIINSLQLEYIKVSNELFDSIEAPKKTRIKE